MMIVSPTLPSAFAVLRDGESVPQRLRGAFVAIGNFDGVHRGHRAAIDAANAGAHKLGRAALALTFEPHPRRHFLPGAKTFRLTPEPVKLRLLASAGLDGAVVMNFNAALAARTAEEFVAGTLVNWLDIGGVVVGDNFRFGKGRGGTPEFLREEGMRIGFEVKVLDRVTWRGKAVSSGAVRTALEAGDIAEANDLLGYSWFIEGKVIRGASRGRMLGFPTANIELDPDCGLRHGIYAVRVLADGKTYDGVASFGRRPQFDHGAPLFEVMLFDFSGDLYDRVLTVEFAGFIRRELKFESVDALKAQMALDCDEARAILARDGGRTGKR
jgi:riboflavin kinase/FMN adenylyltransferase